MWELDYKENWARKLMILNCCVGVDSLESLGLQGDPTSPSQKRSVLGVHWKDWSWSWNSNTLATWCKELSHLKNPDAGKVWGQEEKGTTEDELAGWHQWTWVRVDSRRWWWTGRTGMLIFMGRKESDMAERLNWTEMTWIFEETIFNQVHNNQ